MPAPAADSRHLRAPKTLGGLAALASVACCALPVLITAGAAGAGAGAVVDRLPTLAVVLAAAAAGTYCVSLQTHRTRASRLCRGTIVVTCARYLSLPWPTVTGGGALCFRGGSMTA